MDDIALTEEEWKQKLTPEQYAVLRKGGTERAFTGQYWDCHEDGMYRCAGCGAALFRAGDKFESGTGWPSFDRPAETDALEFVEDRSYGMRRVEVRCKRCGGHLGHLFPDGPPTTGERYCINSCSIDLDKDG
jgi:peptide-methionine (R)-S-oxide reductase